MKIVTWNVNSIRTRESRVLAWLEKNEPDVLCLQETKVVDEAFPHAALESIGYRALIHGQKTYNGVALISRVEATDPMRGFEDGGDDSQARFIAARFGERNPVLVASAYVPNGSSMESDKYSYKRAWLKRLGEWIDREKAADEPFALCGDYNIALDDRDLKDQERWAGGVLFNEDVIADFQRLCDRGLSDAFRLVDDEGGKFSWWDYRQLSFQRNDGLRIDHALISDALTEQISGAWIDREQRKKSACPDSSTASDHAPVVFEFDRELS